MLGHGSHWQVAATLDGQRWRQRVQVHHYVKNNILTKLVFVKT